MSYIFGMQSKEVEISKLQNNSGQIPGLPKNPRLIKDDKYKKLVKSIQDDPEMLALRELIVYPQNGHFIVIAGNMRLRAMQELKYDSAPCKVLPPETTVDKLKAYTIKDNIGYGEHEWDAIANEWDVDQLMEWGLDIPDFVNKKDAFEDDYEIPDEIETDIVLGDLFEIGQHRLLCGDSTKADDVRKLLDGGKPNLMVTDPPYGVNYKPKWRDEALGEGNRQTGEVKNDDRVDWTDAYSLFAGDIAYVWHGDRHAKEVAENLEQCGFNITAQIIWAKQHFAISRGDYHFQHEPCWYAVRKGKKHNWQGSRKESSLWEINNGLSQNGGDKEDKWGHGTQKPVECMARPIRNNSYERESVYDPFLGSGTTMVAAHQLNRKCYGMEISEKYCQIIIDRMLKLDPNLEISKNGKKDLRII